MKRDLVDDQRIVTAEVTLTGPAGEMVAAQLKALGYGQAEDGPFFLRQVSLEDMHAECRWVCDCRGALLVDFPKRGVLCWESA